MTAKKGCPYCNAPVAARNLGRHLRDVHPHESDHETLARADELAKAVGRARPPRARPSEGIPWKLVAFAIVMVLIIVGIGYLLNQAPTAVGSPAPDFTVSDTEGTQFQLSAYEGKPIIVYVMRGTWCGICSANIPTLKDAWATYKDQGLILISINVDRTESLSDLAGYKEDHGADWRFAPDTDSVLTKYNVRDAGATYFIDRDGKIVDYLSGVYGTDRMQPKLDRLVDT